MRPSFFEYVEIVVENVLAKHMGANLDTAYELTAPAAEIISVIAGRPIGCMKFIVENAHTTIRPIAEVEKDAICTAMILCRGDVDLAAQKLEIGRSTLYRKLRGYREAEDQA